MRSAIGEPIRLTPKRSRPSARVYDHTIGVLKTAMRNAKLGREEPRAALQRLDAQARRLERDATGPSVGALVAEERQQSHGHGGRSIFGWEPAPAVARSWKERQCFPCSGFAGA